LQQEQQLAAMQERNRKLIEQEIKALEQQLERKQRLQRETKRTVDQLRSTQELFSKELGPVPADLKDRQLAAMQELERLKIEEGKIIALIDQCGHGPAIAPGTACPTCKQQVSSQYIAELQQSLAAQAGAAQRKQEKIIAKIKEQRELLGNIQAMLERKRQLDDVTKQLMLQEQVLRQHDEELLGLAETMAARKQALPQAIPPDAALVERSRTLDQQVVERKGTLLRMRQQLSELEKRTGNIEAQEHELAQARERLVLLGAERLEKEQQLDRTAQVRNWLQRQFTPFTSTVERHVLMSIHTTFDAVFRQWFGRLIEDDALSTRIDHEFAPVMLQHGYETDVAYLSGGERTAVSLAYRLALVHTIHVMLPHLGTSGVIMLDEPTDGFSAEQLERVRDVLRELRMDQIILVSHEQQLEGFVDHILRVRRTGDGSVVEVAA
jgi:DNA repair protein SbcC/Rad50